MPTEYLTEEQRKKYLAELTPQQQQTLEEYKRYCFNSGLLTKINQSGTFWKLEYELINYSFDPAQPQKSYLKCACGRHVKYLYMCKGDNGEEKGFGINHLQQEADIPLKVVKQVKSLHHTIDRGTDTIISQYHAGLRFPIAEYDLAQKHHLLPSLDAKQTKMLTRFKKLNLPLYPEDMKMLQDCISDYKKEQVAKQQKKWKDEHWLQIQGDEEKREAREEARRKVREREVEMKRQVEIAEKKRQQEYERQIQLLKDIDDNWSRVFWGCAHVVFDNFINYLHYKVACYVMFQNGTSGVGDILRAPQETRTEMTKFLQKNNFVHAAVMQDDPHLIEYLACLKDGNYLCKVMKKYGLISVNSNGEIVFNGFNNKAIGKGQTSLF